VKPVDTEKIDVQAIWREPAPPPTATAGMHRYALNIAQRRGEEFGGDAHQVKPHDACSDTMLKQMGAPQMHGEPRRSPVALEPGTYTVQMVVNGQTYSQPAVVAPDPRGAKPYDADENPDNDDN
jgi:hypothetical protein